MLLSEFKINIKSANEYIDFIQRQNYEKFLLDLLNKSELFKNKLVYIEAQPNSQDDYLEMFTGETYEATLLSNSIINKRINRSNVVWDNELIQWLNNEIKNEFFNCLKRKIKKDKIIVFNIFPFIGAKFRSSLTDYIQDIWDASIESFAFSNPELIKDKEIIIVSFNLDNSFYFKRFMPNSVSFSEIAYVDDYDKDNYIFNITEIEKL